MEPLFVYQENSNVHSFEWIKRPISRYIKLMFRRCTVRMKSNRKAQSRLGEP
jgi:hypothetical protein